MAGSVLDAILAVDADSLDYIISTLQKFRKSYGPSPPKGTTSLLPITPMPVSNPSINVPVFMIDSVRIALSSDSDYYYDVDEGVAKKHVGDE